MKKTLLNLTNINKYYDEKHILRDISLDIADGEFLTLLGPSGCGKTTLLRCIAGLEHVDSGDILLNGGSIKDLPANKRNVNTVFQNYALFPHLNVYDNIAYGPRVRKSMSEGDLRERVKEVLNLVRMVGYEDRMTNQLSGGEKQRIAIARALINKPAILLLDEPLGALDLKLRKHMQRELTQLQKQTKTTFVYVTHDQEEALNMSDRIAVMEKGRIQQIGSPREVYNNPRNIFVADFIGDRNIKKVEIIEKHHDYSKIRFGENIIDIRCSNNAECNSKPGDLAILAIHRDKMKVFNEYLPNSIMGVISSIHYGGSQIRIEIDIRGESIIVIAYQGDFCNFKIKDEVYVSWEDTGAILLPIE